MLHVLVIMDIYNLDKWFCAGEPEIHQLVTRPSATTTRWLHYDWCPSSDIKQHIYLHLAKLGLTYLIK